MGGLLDLGTLKLWPDDPIVQRPEFLACNPYPVFKKDAVIGLQCVLAVQPFVDVRLLLPD